MDYSGEVYERTREDSPVAKAQEQKVPYMLVVGDKEAEGGPVSVRERTEGDQGTMTVDDCEKIIADAQV